MNRLDGEILEKRRISRKLILLIDIILLIVSIFAYKFIYKVETCKLIYSDQSEKFVSQNASPVFRIDKIVLYSSANWIDNSDGKLRNIDISQFTDMEIFIDNKNKIDNLTPENTISKLYIDNISIKCKEENGEKILNYKNPLNSGKFVDLENYTDDTITFKIPLSNEENKNTDYSESTFYTDCSNPISLGYINKNLLTGCMVEGTNASISGNGTILKMAGVNIEDLEAILKFSIHLINNYNEEFVCNLEIDNSLESETEGEEGIYSGYIMKVVDTRESKYNFLKIN